MALPDEGFTLGDASDQEAVCSRAAKKTPPAAVCRGRPSLRAESLPECDVEQRERERLGPLAPNVRPWIESGPCFEPIFRPSVPRRHGVTV